ncbi:RagB/SusD family nutrient uptake outer membrane protein [Aquimarina agarilytica]|uniref:RagB/SusD family nutrient uptake outer membrane protein n=1 Tax=Aquimarina agarilytica TaxID=1087449 RepID=UPI000288E51C|nr:RagB/SusD family nutrient uptake outer membrane protein [Aquimarina agarilytica]
MKKIGIILLMVSLLYGCENELNIKPQGSITDDLLESDSSVLEGFVIAAYAVLDGNLDNADVWRASASNWVYGEVTSDNAYKGSEPNDAQEINQFESYEPLATNSFLNVKWRAVYEGVFRANQAILRVNSSFSNGNIDSNTNDNLTGEALFLRGHYHFEAKKMWNKIPYIDENAAESVPNRVDVWDDIEGDFERAIELLPESSKVGRANSWMAKTYLAKAHMYQLDYDAAKPILDDIINNGPYELTALFSDNFNAEKNNNSESIFAVQFSVNDNSENDSNGRWGDILNFPQTGEAGGGCCGFFQPSQNLVNAFKTDANGLPLLDDFNEVDVTSEEQQFNKFRSENPNFEDSDSDSESYDVTFLPEQGTVDPRLDRTVGRRGIDYQGFGIHKGRSWIRDMSNGGSFLPRKNVHMQSQLKTQSTTGGAWAPNLNQLNYVVIRYAEVLLWRAEIAAAEADLATAVELVDMVRARASNEEDFITQVDSETEVAAPAANYLISGYGSFENQEQAMKAVAHEQRIELAMEGHRFFELVRQNKMIEILGKYLNDEQSKFSDTGLKSFVRRQHLNNVEISIDDEYFPIPQRVIDESNGVVTQN